MWTSSVIKMNQQFSDTSPAKLNIMWSKTIWYHGLFFHFKPAIVAILRITVFKTIMPKLVKEVAVDYVVSMEIHVEFQQIVLLSGGNFTVLFLKEKTRAFSW